MSKDIGVGERVARAITKAFNPSQIVSEALNISVPDLLDTAARMETLTRGMREFAEFAEELQKSVEANAGQLREVKDIAADNRFHLANVATIAQNLPVYFERDPETVRAILLTVDLPVLEQVAQQLPARRRLELIKALDPTGVKL